ncbi:hypothetical protein CJ030_MR2G012395 [Morella rubra]|uniref:Uncharacterized protein n=1 Tax=Morella rubra TaxID=262757 RepID=A0A6A1WIB7_9ROSI|nr:hypothetical protein CJ030_MR2G012395 [Morella rubra]
MTPTSLRCYRPSIERRSSPNLVNSPAPHDVVHIPPSPPPFSTTHPRGNSPPATTSRARRRVREPSSSSSPLLPSRPLGPENCDGHGMWRTGLPQTLLEGFHAETQTRYGITLWDELEDTDGSGGSSSEECYDWENFMGHHANSSGDDRDSI